MVYYHNQTNEMVLVNKIHKDNYKFLYDDQLYVLIMLNDNTVDSLLLNMGFTKLGKL